jgi:hypothetical protein
MPEAVVRTAEGLPLGPVCGLCDAGCQEGAVELIRSQVDKTELGPREEDGLDAILHGAVAGILISSDLIFCEQQKPSSRWPLKGFHRSPNATKPRG